MRRIAIYPSTNYIGGAFQIFREQRLEPANWQVSGLTQNASGLIPISTSGGAATYGGTPSDQIHRALHPGPEVARPPCIFYPFILMDAPGKPWRGNIGLGSDLVQSTTTTVRHFSDRRRPSQFAQRHCANLTVAYSGAPTDFTFRRFILHYANLCAVAGGVDLFLIGSELRGLEILRGPNWTPSGTTDANGHALWDYPFVAGLIQLAADIARVFDAAGLTENSTDYKNLIAYSPDWSSLERLCNMPGQNGQWPHLDSLFASPNIDVVSFDNYLPLSDWTLDDGGLDCQNWNAPGANLLAAFPRGDERPRPVRAPTICKTPPIYKPTSRAAKASTGITTTAPAAAWASTRSAPTSAAPCLKATA